MFYKSFLYFSCSDRVKEDDEVYCQNVAPSQEFQVELFTSLSLLSRPGDGCRLQAVAVVAKYFPIKSLKEPIFHPSSELQSC